MNCVTVLLCVICDIFYIIFNKLQTVVSVDVGYVTTSICMVQAAYVLMAERDKLPPGYVYVKLCVVVHSILYSVIS